MQNLKRFQILSVSDAGQFQRFDLLFENALYYDVSAISTRVRDTLQNKCDALDYVQTSESEVHQSYVSASMWR